MSLHGAGLRVRGLACVRGDRLLFEGLTFDVQPGAALRVIGPNGAGKSSLLRLLAGLLTPAAGEVERPDRIAYLGHENALKLDASLASELRHWARLDDADDRMRQAAIARFGLAELMDLPVRLLSNGQRRRAALARVSASGASLWLLDEPEVGLDTRSVGALSAAIGEHRARGGAVVLATHILELGDADELALDSAVQTAI